MNPGSWNLNPKPETLCDSRARLLNLFSGLPLTDGLEILLQARGLGFRVEALGLRASFGRFWVVLARQLLVRIQASRFTVSSLRLLVQGVGLLLF